MTIGGTVLSGKDLANEFNRHFLAFGDFPAGTPSNIGKYMEYNLQHSLFLYPATPAEINDIILGFKNNCSCGFDGIKVAPIKAIADLIVNLLCHITNLILTTGIFPEKMKMARVAVLFKGGAANIISNYRPISVLPLFSKIVEKVINTRITTYLNKHKLISPSQYGFQRKKSTESALLSIKDKLINNIENQLYTLGVFLDFSKAFDSIKHNILLSKLPYYGIRGTSLKLLQNYLSGRSQYVVINNATSNSELIKFGVPQGSILGPTLFLLYINDMVSIPQTLLLSFTLTTQVYFFW